MIYFDNAATTPMSKAAMTAMTQVMENTFGNPSSIHNHGRAANKILRKERQELADLLHTKNQHIIFTSGGTESNNTAIKGYALAHQDQGKHIITTAIEHHSVLATIEYLVDKFGFEATYMQPQNGEITAQQIKEALREDTILVSTMYANNETGYLLPIKEIAEVLKHHPTAYHVDAVQIMGKLPVYPEKLGIDFMSASAHKFHGPKGIGFLYANQMKFDKFLHGGDQEDKRRAGTENLAAIAGMIAALKENLSSYQANIHHVDSLKTQLLTELDETDYYINNISHTFPYVVNLGFPTQANDLLLMRLDLAGISISTGSACTAGTVEPSHVLEAFYGSDSNRLKESIRISFSEQNTSEEVHQFTTILKEILGG